jgi:hypothetical protein
MKPDGETNMRSPILSSEQILNSQLAPATITRRAAYQIYGVTKNQVASMMLNFFHYPYNYLDTLATYYMRHWTGQHFYANMVDGAITGSEDSIKYLVVYQGCTPYQAKRAQQLRLSFRSAKPEFGLCAYVIVRIHTEAL